MSRIIGMETEAQKHLNMHRNALKGLTKKKNDKSPNSYVKDTPTNGIERQQIRELLHKLPKLDSIFEVHRKIGEGTFSTVYLGTIRQHSQLPDKEKRWYAIKHLVPTAHPARIEHELQCLQHIGGKENVIGVDLCLRHLDTIVFVMPYIAHTKFSEYVDDMDAEELRQYMVALLTALRHVHSFGVIHRDVKPSNFLYDRQNRRYLLVDFGLSQQVCESPPRQNRKRSRDESNSVRSAEGAECSCFGRAGVCGPCLTRASARAARAGTQGFRPPEVLLKYPRQTGAVDVWASGVVAASVLLARYPLLRAADDLSALAELCELLGTAALQRTAKRLGRRLLTSVYRPRLCLRQTCLRLRGLPRAPCAHCREPDAPPPSESRVGPFPEAAFAFADSLLEADPHLRPSAAAALAHPFLAGRW